MSWFALLVSTAKSLNPFHVLKLEEENAQLRRDKLALEKELQKAQAKLQDKADLIRSPKGYCFFAADPTPFCATCYETKDIRVSLEPPEEWNGGIRRNCPSCGRSYWDEPSQPVKPFRLARGSARWRMR